jgi:hypothetical protein
MCDLRRVVWASMGLEVCGYELDCRMRAVEMVSVVFIVERDGCVGEDVKCRSVLGP